MKKACPSFERSVNAETVRLSSIYALSTVGLLAFALLAGWVAKEFGYRFDFFDAILFILLLVGNVLALPVWWWLCRAPFLQLLAWYRSANRSRQRVARKQIKNRVLLGLAMLGALWLSSS
jgi:MFS family permease